MYQARRITGQLRATVAATCAGIAHELVVQLRDRNPKDTTHSSKNWVATAGSRHAFVAGDKTSPDGGPQAVALDALDGYRLDMGPIHVANNVDYMRALMDGYSPQAPAGWVDETVRLVAEHADMIYRKVVNVVARRVR